MLKRLFSGGNEVKTHDFGGLSIKSVNGKHYLLGRFTNRWRDRSPDINPSFSGDIFRDAAHKEYVAWLDKNPDMAPPLWSWHTPGTARKSKAVWWDYTGNSVYMMWPLEEEEAKDLIEYGAGRELGLSHTYAGIANEKDGTFMKYRTYEVSVLPLDKAANLFTGIYIQKGNNQMPFNPDKRDLLVQMHGEDFVKSIEEDDERLAKTLDALGIESKEANEEVAPESAADPEEDSVEESAPVVEGTGYAKESDVVSALQAVQQQIMDVIENGLKELDEKYESRLKELEVPLAEKAAAAADAMPVSVLAGFTESVLGKKGAQEDGRSALAKSKPEETQPESNHMLAGFLK